MRLRTLTVSVIAAALATVPLAGAAAAQPGDRDCPDFASQAEAQEALDSQVGDPERLDRDDDGEACEDHDYGSSPAPTTTPAPTTAPAEDDDETPPADDDSDDGQVSVIPRGGVDTGDGSSDGSSAPLVIGAVVALGAATAAVRRRAQTR